VDGGIDVETAPRTVAAGARVLVAGTAVFGGAGAAPGHAAQALHALRAAVNAS
jgi:ribulose-phosphate 3-epimerase